MGEPDDHFGSHCDRCRMPPRFHAGWAARRFYACAVLWLTLIVAPVLGGLSVQARDDASFDKSSARRDMERQRDDMRRQQKEARRQQQEARRLQQEAKEQARQAREQARQAREAAQQAREQARQQAQDQREQRQQAQEARKNPTDEGAGQQPSVNATKSNANGNGDSTGSAASQPKSVPQAPASNAQNASGKSTVSKNDGDKGQDKDKRRDKAESKDKTDKTDKADKPDDVEDMAEEDDLPPSTMVGVFKKLFGSPQPEKVVPVAPKVTVKSPIGAAVVARSNPPVTASKNVPPKPTAAAAASNVKPAVPKKSGTRPPPLDLSLVQRHEVLAVNVSSEMLSQARLKGFKPVEQNSLSNLKMSLTRLVAPAGMSTEAAESALAAIEARQSGGTFATNKLYRIYKTATGTIPNGNAGAGEPSQPQGVRCAGDRCYAWEMMGWNRALNACAKSVPVGIIDTAVDVSHPALQKRNISVGHLSQPNAGKSPDWHGTGVLTILAGDGSSDTPGLIPDANFYVADVFFADADGQPATDTYSLLRGIDWLKQKGAKLVNMSLSGPADDLVRQAIDKMAQTGVVFVAAAGNDGPGSPPSYPAAYDPVIAVTAVNQNMVGYRYANQGNYIDLAAPGVGIWTAMPGARRGYHSGTSFAAPYVTAALATMYRRFNGKSKAAILKQVSFRDLGVPGRDDIYGNGLLLAPTSCGTGASVASAPGRGVSGGVVVPSSGAATTPVSIGFGFQSSHASTVPASGREILPWASGN